MERSASIQPAAPMPTAVTGWAAANSRTTSMITPRVRATSLAGVSHRVWASTRPVGVDHPTGHLGAADVDPDRQRPAPAGHRRVSPAAVATARSTRAAPSATCPAPVASRSASRGSGWRAADSARHSGHRQHSGLPLATE